MQLGNGTTTGALPTASAIIDNDTLAFREAGAVTQGTQFSGAAITGTGGLVQAGPGTVVLNTANSFTGPTTISAGTLQLGDGTNNGSVSGGIVDNSQLVLNNNTAQTYAGTIGGNGSVTKNGGSLFTLAGSSSYGGTTTATGGSMALAAGLSSILPASTCLPIMQCLSSTAAR